MDEITAAAAARLGDMRVQVVLRELNQGALAGLPSQVSEYGARLVIAALDQFDYQAVQSAWGDGFHAGAAFERARQASRQPPR